MTKEIVNYTVSDMEKLAVAIAKSKLFGMTTPDQALALMAIAQAEGLHPAIAARDYHIVQGRPTLKADAMLARFQAAGGKVEWHAYSDTECSATFTHPQGGTVRIDWDLDWVKKAEIKNDSMYRKYPRNMLRARVISEGIRTIYPGVVIGTYTPEEAADFDPPKSAMAQWAETPPTIEGDAKPNKLQAAYDEFVKRLNACTAEIQVTELVSRNGKLLQALREQDMALFEALSVEINKTQEAFMLAKDGE